MNKINCIRIGNSAAFHFLNKNTYDFFDNVTGFPRPPHILHLVAILDPNLQNVSMFPLSFETMDVSVSFNYINIIIYYLKNNVHSKIYVKFAVTLVFVN